MKHFMTREEKLQLLADTQTEYITLLSNECGDLGALAYVHGYRPDMKKVKKGEDLRAKIKLLKESL